MERMISLDRLRVIALLGVVFYHLTPGLVPGGYLGVNIFFSLAGFFTLLQQLEKRDEETVQPGYLVKLGLAKIKKLYPPLLITLFLSCLLIYVLFSASLGDVRSSVTSSIFSYNNYDEIFSGGDYFANTGKLAPFTHLWALAMEMQVYFLFFALAPKIRRAAQTKKGLKKLFLILLALSLLSYFYSLILLFTGSDFSRIYYSTVARLYSFSLGSIAGLLTFMSRRITKQTVKKAAMNEKAGGNKAVLVLVLLSIPPFFLLKPGKFMFGLGFFVYSLFIALLLFFLSEGEHRAIPRLDGFTKYFAERSYAIFLWHYPLIKIVDKLFAHTKVGPLIYFPLFFILCFLFSEGTYRFVKSLKGAKILYLLSILMSIALLLAPYEALAGSNAREELMNSVLENERLIKERTEAQEKAISGEDGEEEKSIAKEEGGEGAEAKKGKEAEKTKTPEELKAELAESPTYETALSFLEETNAAHPDVSISVEDFNRLHLKDFLLIGDSIASMSYHTLYTYLPNGVYDSNHSRQMDEAPAFLENYLKTKAAPELIFVQLGTNAGVDKADIDKLRALAPESKFFLYSVVLPYKSEEDDRNNAIYSYREEHKSEEVYLIDWYKHTKTLDIFFEDGIHPGEEGAKILAQLMLRAMVEAGE